MIWISENARAVRDGDGRLLHYEGTVIDVTERKRAEEELRLSESELRRHRDHLEEMVARAHQQPAPPQTRLEDEIVERRRAESELRAARPCDRVDLRRHRDHRPAPRPTTRWST